MGAPTTIRRGKLRKHDLALVEKDGIFYGRCDSVTCAQGTDAELVWRQLRENTGKADPKYFGYDGAKSRFLTFFPDGFA